MATRYTSIPLQSAQARTFLDPKTKRFAQYPPEAVRIMVWSAIHYHEMVQRGSGIRRVAEQAGVSQTTVRKARFRNDPKALRHPITTSVSMRTA